MIFKLVSSLLTCLALSTSVNASPVYYIFDGAITGINDTAGLVAAENLTIGSAFRTVFLIDKAEDGTTTNLSMYPFLNQQFNRTLNDRSLNNGHTTLDYFYADLVSQPLMYGNSWKDLGIIEYNYGNITTESYGVNYLNLFGSNSPNTTNARTEVSSFAQTSDDFLGGDFRFTETATIQQGSTFLSSTIIGRVTLVDVTDEYVATVPLPPSVWLFGTGLVGIIGAVRRKKA